MSAQPDDLFLSEEQVDRLTGIRRGDTIAGQKRTKHQLQAEFLRLRGIAFIENARGKPIVTRAAIEGRAPKEASKRAWSPKVVGA